MKKKIKIIRSAVGSMPSMGLIKELQKAGVEVIGIDSNPLSAGFCFLRKSYVVPCGNDPDFIRKILDIIDIEKPDAIISGPEEELIPLSKNKAVIEKRGALLLCPDYRYVRICADKMKTAEAFKRMGIPAPEIFDLDTVKLPCVIKPRFGRGSADIHIIKDKKDLDFYFKKNRDFIIQEFIEGDEYTVDILADRDGSALSVIPRLRFGVESGVSIKGRTVYDDEIIQYSRKIAKGLRLFGPSCIQCIKNKDGVKFIEVNTRFGGGSILSIKADPFIVSNLIKIIKREKPAPGRGFKEGLTMLRYYSEVFIPKNSIDKPDFAGVVIFDLDNTLYNAEQYHLGAFNKIAEYLSGKCRISKKNIYGRLKKIWTKKTSMYPYLFDDLLKPIGLERELKNVVKIFNDYSGKLELFPNVALVLKKLKNKGFIIGMITDGDVKRQKRKIRLLGIERFFDEIIFTKELGAPKPSVVPFQEMVNRLKIDPCRSFYVGDNPLIDFQGAKKTGMKTVRLLSGEFKKNTINEYIDCEIDEFKEVLRITDNG